MGIRGWIALAKPYTQIILPKALFLFRWGAMGTLVFGLIYYVAGMKSTPMVQGIPSWEIHLGMILGTIMWFNVWFIIWPKQKRIIETLIEFLRT